MGRTKTESTQYRFSVPTADESVKQWLEAQEYLSISLRLLIKADIVRNGCMDVVCRSVEQAPRQQITEPQTTGSPPLSAKPYGGFQTVKSDSKQSNIDVMAMFADGEALTPRP